MATGTFTYNALRMKTLKECIKTQRKIVSHSNSTRVMLLASIRTTCCQTIISFYMPSGLSLVCKVLW